MYTKRMLSMKNDGSRDQRVSPSNGGGFRTGRQVRPAACSSSPLGQAKGISKAESD